MTGFSTHDQQAAEAQHIADLLAQAHMPRLTALQISPDHYYIHILPRDRAGAVGTLTSPLVSEFGVDGFKLLSLDDRSNDQPPATPSNDPSSARRSNDKPDSKSDTKPAPTPQPTLDELLGLPTSPAPKQDSITRDANAPAPANLNEQQLNELLSGTQITDAFEQAVVMMNDAAKRLGDASDPGIDTQRVQEDIIRKLDQVLDALQQQQQQQSSSKSKQQQRQNPSEPQGSQRSQQQQQQQAQQPANDNQGATMPPGKQEGALRPGLEGAKAAWGSLPQRVRDMLLQGAGDRFSSKYQNMTEAYYRKLAEEKESK